MLWIDFCADNELNGNKENGCFCSTPCVTLSSWHLDRPRAWSCDLPLRIFLCLNHHDRDNNEEYTNTRTTGWAKAPVGNLLVDHVYLWLLSWWNYCTWKLVSSLHFRRCMLSICSGDCFVVERVCWWYCTWHVMSSLDEHHHTCMVIFPCVFIQSIRRQSW